MLTLLLLPQLLNSLMILTEFLQKLHVLIILPLLMLLNLSLLLLQLQLQLFVIIILTQLTQLLLRKISMVLLLDIMNVWNVHLDNLDKLVSVELLIWIERIQQLPLQLLLKLLDIFLDVEHLLIVILQRRLSMDYRFIGSNYFHAISVQQVVFQFLLWKLYLRMFLDSSIGIKLI